MSSAAAKMSFSQQPQPQPQSSTESSSTVEVVERLFPRVSLHKTQTAVAEPTSGKKKTKKKKTSTTAGTKTKKAKSKVSPPTAPEAEQLQQPPVTASLVTSEATNSKQLATGALADILDLDFGPVHNNEVNQRNRQYILEQQLPDPLSEPISASCKSYSTREPLRPSSIEASKYCENNILEANSSKAALSSSNSSTASSSGSRRASAASSLRKVAASEAKISAATIEAGGCILRDTKIEIAGGREVYSQSKARSGRHKNRQRHSGEFGGHLPRGQVDTPEVALTYQQPCKVLKETVFSSEIHSIEYNSPMASVASLSSGSSTDSPKVMSASRGGQAKNINVDTGVVVFDDIRDCDVNVTYDLIEGEFPPPNITGLVVRDPNDLLTSDDLLPKRADDVDSMVLGEEADRRSEASSGGSKIIGDITIAEYEGSPRRYRPRAASSQTSDAEASTSSAAPTPKQVQQQKRPLRLPGFPQRVLPPAENNDEEAKEVAASFVRVPPPPPPPQEEELLKFEDEHPVAGSAATTAASKAEDFESKMRYEFSETRKVLDEFFHKADGVAENLDEEDLNYVLRKNNNYVGQRLASEDGTEVENSPEDGVKHSNIEQDLLLTSPTPVVKEEPPNSLTVSSIASKGPHVGVSPLDQPLLNFGTAGSESVNNGGIEEATTKVAALKVSHGGQPQPLNDLDSRNFTLSPETTDCDSADLESEMSVNDGSFHSSGPKMQTAMPVLEDGLSSGHASDLEDDVIYSSSGSVVLKKQQQQQQPQQLAQQPQQPHGGQLLQQQHSGQNNHHLQHHNIVNNSQFHHHHHHHQKNNNRMVRHHELLDSSHTPTKFSADNSAISSVVTSPTSSVRSKRTSTTAHQERHQQPPPGAATQEEPKGPTRNNGHRAHTESLDPLSRSSSELLDVSTCQSDESVAAALKDIKMAIQATRVLQHQTRIPSNGGTTTTAVCATTENITTAATTSSTTAGNHCENGEADDPWIKRQQQSQMQILDSIPTSTAAAAVLSLPSAPAHTTSLLEHQQENSISKEVEDDEDEDDEDEEGEEDDEEEEEEEEDDEEEEEEEEEEESGSEIVDERVPTPKTAKDDEDLDTDQETDRLLGQQYNDDNGYYDQKNEAAKKKGTKTKEAVTDPKVLIEGVLFRARYLGSTQLVCDGQPTKATRMMQAEEAVSRIKALAPDGESQPSTEVDLFISTEKIMVLNTDLKEIMMDHSLRSISYIADIGDLLVIMARRRIMPQDGEEIQVIGSTPKMICHVFESEEAQFIAQSIGQAFQVAYVEFLKANGIEDHSFVKEMDYQEVLNSQEIFGNELALFAKKELQKEVVVPKAKGEILGVVIVESGWGSMLPTIVLANLLPTGPAARCGQLNIGDQVIAINGISLVGLPLSTCQTYIKNTKNKTAVKLTAVSCAPVVEVKIKRPDTKYQLGFSVQNGVICSLLRGGIAERGGVRVGHRIIEINGQSVVAVPHEKIVNLLATSVGEITMKTMPTSMFRLLTGQETPLYI